MSLDHYAGAARRWARGATIVYAPIARQLVAASPHSLARHMVLDVGAGTGVASTALIEAGARPTAADLSYDMLAWQVSERASATAADVCALPFADRSFDDTVAAFVLNHLVRPAAGLDEIIRVTRSGGAVLACVYANSSRSEVRDAIDRAAQREGWTIPEWYLEIKRRATPLLGTADDMERVAKNAGLIDVVVDQRPVDVGVTDADQLVDYRLGQAHFAIWLDQIGPAREERIRRQLIEEIRPIMQPYRPIVVFMTAISPTA